MPSGAPTVDWVENSARGASSGRPWAALWGSRGLIGYLALRDLKLRYRQAAHGVRPYPTGVNVRGPKAATHHLPPHPYRLTIEERCSCA